MDGKHGRTTSGVECHHRLWAAHTIEQRRAGHAIIAHGRQTRSNDIRRDMPSPPLDSIHGRTTLGMACHHHLWAAQTVGRHRAWHAIVALGRQTPSTSSGMACHHGHWTPHTIERSRSWHAIIALERQTRLNDVGRGMSSSPLD